jgi:hypothetical protein
MMPEVVRLCAPAQGSPFSVALLYWVSPKMRKRGFYNSTPATTIGQEAEVIMQKVMVTGDWGAMKPQCIFLASMSPRAPFWIVPWNLFPSTEPSSTGFSLSTFETVMRKDSLHSVSGGQTWGKVLGQFRS